MKASGYTLDYIAKRLELIAKSKDFAELKKEVEGLKNLVSKYPEDKEIEDYYTKLEEICKKKEISELKNLTKKIRNEARWRQIGSASGSSLPYKDYRRLEKL